MHADLIERQINIKILFSVIRSPLLCNVFYKTERKLYEKEKLDSINQQCVLTTRQYNLTPENATGFIKKLHKQVDG